MKTSLLITCILISAILILLLGVKLGFAQGSATQDLAGQPLPEPGSTASAALPADSPATLRPQAILTVGTSCTYDTIQKAIDDASSGDIIRVEGKTWTGSQAIVNIPNKDLSFYGGYNSNCTSQLPGVLTILDGDHLDSVIKTLPSVATLRYIIFYNFEIIHGAATTGGGVSIGDKYTLNIKYSAIHDNQAQKGGGISLGSESNLYLTATSVYSNTASQTGGGIYCNGEFGRSSIHTYGDTNIGWYLYAYPIIIDLGNHATSGGGIYLDQCNYYLYKTNIWYNQATEAGGGIFATNSSQMWIYNPVSMILFNTAQDGGGIYLDNSTLNMYTGQLNQNQASRNGGGLYATGTSTHVFLDPYVDKTIPNLQLSYNSAGDTGGGAYLSDLTTLVAIYIDRTYVQSNTADVSASAFYIGDGGYLWLGDSMIVEGDAPDAVIKVDTHGYSTSVTIRNSTFAGNTGNNVAIVGIDDSLTLSMQNLIVWGNDGVDLVAGWGSVTVSCSILQMSYPGNNNLVADPLFVNPAASDYHIQKSSPAIDHCATGTSMDIDNQKRPSSFDITAPAKYDAGADEYYFTHIYLPVIMR
jgi:predicted outer membrane repeat protein